MNDEFKTLKKFDAGKGREGFLCSLPALEEQDVGKISRLPVSIRIVLESVLRNCDGKKVRRKDVEALAKWNAQSRALPVSLVGPAGFQDFPAHSAGNRHRSSGESGIPREGLSL